MRSAVFCLILYIQHFINGASLQENEPFQLWKSEEALNWTEADMSCRTRGGQLLYDEPSLGVRIPKTIGQLLNGGEIWLGARVISTPWIWENTNAYLYTHMGYSPAAGVEVGRHLVSHDNQVFTCSASCSTPYVALQGTYCGCLQTRPSDLRNVSTRVGVCPGNSEESCGNATGYDIYYDDIVAHFGNRLPKFRISGNNAYDFTLAYLSVAENNLTSIATSNSQLYKKGVLCDQDSRHDRRLLNFTRDEALNTCSGKGLYTVRTDRDLPPLEPGEYWIGLRRSYAWRWVNGVTVDVTHLPRRDNRGQCLGLRKKDNVTKTLDFRCKEKKNFICVARPSTASGVSPTPKENTSLDWKIWLAVGVGVGAALVIVPAAVCTIMKRSREGKKEGPPLPIAITDEFEAEYSEVQDIMNGGGSSLPDVVTDEGVYSEPCAEGDRFVGKNNISTTLKSATLPKTHQIFQERDYDGQGGENRSYLPEPIYKETNDLSGYYATPRSEGSSSSVMNDVREGSPKIGTKWEPGRYDVPRNKDNSKATNEEGITVLTLRNDTTKYADDKQSTYDVPASKDNIYAKPKKVKARENAKL